MSTGGVVHRNAAMPSPPRASSNRIEEAARPFAVATPAVAGPARTKHAKQRNVTRPMPIVVTLATLRHERTPRRLEAQRGAPARRHCSRVQSSTERARVECEAGSHKRVELQYASALPGRIAIRYRYFSRSTQTHRIICIPRLGMMVVANWAVLISGTDGGAPAAVAAAVAAADGCCARGRGRR